MRKKIHKTIEYGLFIGAVAIISAGVYFNVLYYERHRRKERKSAWN